MLSVSLCAMLIGCAPATGDPTRSQTAPPGQPTDVASAPADRAHPSFLALLSAAGRAQQAGNLDSMRTLLRAAQALAPDNGQVLFILAREEARAGNADEALTLLERLTIQGFGRDIHADTGFAALQREPHRARFADVADRLQRAAAPLVRSDTTFVLRDPDFIPEGIAYDSSDGAFYIGSLYRHSVVRIDSSGREEVFLGAGRDGLGQVLGMRVDAHRRRLWLATLVPDTAAPSHSSGVRGWAFLHAHEIPTGRLIARHAAPDSALPHLLNDLVITSAGDVYVSDTEAHTIYRLRPGGTHLERAHGDDALFRYPNGIAIDPTGRLLYMAHLEGISVGEIGARGLRAVTMMPRPAGVAGGGIDGLYACEDRLIAVQGLAGFQQVTAFDLSPEGTAIVAARPLERRHPIYDWPTTGVLVGGDFHYIANAQLRRLASSGALSAPVIPGRSTVLRLRGVCAY